MCPVDCVFILHIKKKFLLFQFQIYFFYERWGTYTLGLVTSHSPGASRKLLRFILEEHLRSSMNLTWMKSGRKPEYLEKSTHSRYSNSELADLPAFNLCYLVKNIIFCQNIDTVVNTFWKLQVSSSYLLYPYYWNEILFHSISNWNKWDFHGHSFIF